MKNARQVFVADAAAVSAIGDSLEAMWGRLCCGESAIAPVRRFSTERLEFHNAACIADLDGPPEGEGGRVGELLRRTLVQLKGVPTGARVIWTGVKGNVDYIETRRERESGGERREKEGGEKRREREGGGERSSSDDSCPPEVSRFPRYPYEYRELAGRILGIEADGLEVNAACAASAVGLALGAQMIASGECESVLVCGADVVSRFTFMGFSALRGLSPTVCRPFDARRDGLCLGDGAAAMLLVSEAAAEKNNLPVLARLTGWGIANDANHITGPARDACGLIAAIRSALDQAELAAERVEAFCAHGTGTVYNDGMELTALEALFGARRFPVFSIKGAVGHTLGAAGAMEAAVSVKALGEKTVPATSGLNEPEERAAGRLSAGPQRFAGNNILTTNSGFGGINAALVFEKRSD